MCIRDRRVASLGAANPLMFVVLLVGVQGLIEIIVGCAVGGVLARAVDVYKRQLLFCGFAFSEISIFSL